MKIIREDIETAYKDKLSQIYESLERLVQKKDIKKSDIIEHDIYVKELLRYIITDMKQFRQIQGDKTLGGMIICETSETDFKKITPRAPRCSRVFNLTQILETEQLQDTKGIAELIKTKAWS